VAKGGENYWMQNPVNMAVEVTVSIVNPEHISQYDGLYE
jgi:hypothetical protein